MENVKSAENQPNTKKCFIFKIIICVLLAITLILAFIVKNNILKIENFKNELTKTQQSFNSYKNSCKNTDSTPSKSSENTTPTPTQSSKNTNLECRGPFKEDIVTDDGKYFLFRDLSVHYICDQTDRDNRYVIPYYESRIQNGYTLIITVRGDKMFIADLKNRTLRYITINNFPPGEEIKFNSDGSPDLWLFGPNQEDLDQYSPLGDMLIFGASDCHDCMTVVKYYVLNLNTLKITPLGRSNKRVKWINNNTVSWEETSFDIEQRSLGIKTKVID
jgi:hypothetical protein